MKPLSSPISWSTEPRSGCRLAAVVVHTTTFSNGTTAHKTNNNRDDTVSHEFNDLLITLYPRLRTCSQSVSQQSGMMQRNGTGQELSPLRRRSVVVINVAMMVLQRCLELANFVGNVNEFV